MSFGLSARLRASGTFLTPSGVVVPSTEVLDRYVMLALCWIDAGVKVKSPVSLFPTCSFPISAVFAGK